LNDFIINDFKLLVALVGQPEKLLTCMVGVIFSFSDLVFIFEHTQSAECFSRLESRNLRPFDQEILIELLDVLHQVTDALNQALLEERLLACEAVSDLNSVFHEFTPVLVENRLWIFFLFLHHFWQISVE